MEEMAQNGMPIWPAQSKPSMTVTAYLRSKQQPSLMSFARLPKRKKLNFLGEETIDESEQLEPNKVSIADVDAVKSD